jgi:FkbM family methyltransferase
LINKIYVINLKSCYDRKKHIEEEFKRLKINNYEIFEATDKDSLQVKEMMKTDFVKKFPPCFRCNKNKCRCSNNILIKHQIGNWCSFINVMNDIIKNDYKGLIMICEDDIKFTNNGMDILNKMTTKDNLEKYNISFEKPILIRAGSGFNKNHSLKHSPKLIRKDTMSNPCFICNKYYAKSFIKNLKIINTTSDVFIHRNILSLDKTIQSFTILPQPIYELSCGKFKKFKSEIHPKGLDNKDKIEAKNHFKRVEYKDFLCIGHPRCGTTSISYYLTQMGYNVGHENMGENGVSSWVLAVEDENYPLGNIKEKFRYYFKNVIHVVRNPYDAIPSIILENKYSPGNKSYKFKKKHIKKNLNINLPDFDFNNLSLLDETELAIKTFIYWNKICELCKPETICKIEDISSLQKFNTKNITLDKSKKNSNKLYLGKVYEKPYITNDIYEKIDANLKQELKFFCKKYDYEYLLDKYQSNDNKLSILSDENIFIINNDFKMYVPPSKTDGIFISLRNKKTWEPSVSKGMLYKFNEKKIDTFIDIGANIGYYTLLLANKNIKTYSFEPNLENYNILTKNLKINNFNNSLHYNLGLSDSIGKLEFYYRREKSGHGSFNKKIVEQQNLNLCKIIKVNKLDNIDIQGKNIMVKIDIEGYELNAIMGMLQLLDSKKIKVFCIEISRKFYGNDVEKEIINLLKKYFKVKAVSKSVSFPKTILKLSSKLYKFL